MHLSEIYAGQWVEQEEILFRVTAGNSPITKNSPSSNDGLFASKEQLCRQDTEAFGGHQWMVVVKRYYQISGASVIFNPFDVVEWVKL